MAQIQLIQPFFGFFELRFHDSTHLNHLFAHVIYLETKLSFNLLNLFILFISNIFSLFKNIFLLGCHLLKFGINRFKLGQNFLLKGLGTDCKH